MPTMAAAGVIYFAGSGALAAGTAAVASAAVQGAIYGAVVGGGMGLLKGGNTKGIFKNALKGAAIGGASGGALSLGSMAMSGATSGALGSTSTQQLGKLGVDPTLIDKTKSIGEAMKTIGTSAPTGAPIDTSTASSRSLQASNRSLVPPPPPPPPRPSLLSDEMGKIMAGTAQGAAQGYGGYLAAQEEAEAQADIQKRRMAEEERLRAGNVAAPTSNIRPGKVSFPNQRPGLSPDWLTNHLQGGTANAQLA